MIDAFSRLLIDASTFTPLDNFLKAINPMSYYNRYRDEKSLPQKKALELRDRIVNGQMETYIKDKLATQTESQKSWKTSSGDILDLALSDPDYGTSASTSELVDQLKTFFFAGHDTTASTISWSYYFLSHHPNQLLRLRKELDSIFGANTTPSQVSQKLISDPKLLDKIRLYPRSYQRIITVRTACFTCTRISRQLSFSNYFWNDI